jgi:ribosome-binding ATPase YchF (GTP1/OBG family)
MKAGILGLPLVGKSTLCLVRKDYEVKDGDVIKFRFAV